MSTLLQKSIDSFFSKPILSVAGWTAGTSLLGFAALLGAITWVLTATTWLAAGWMETAADVVAGAASFILAWFLFPVTTVLIASFFADTAAGRIERLEYQLPDAKGASLWEEIRGGLSFAATAIGLNVICLPLYFIPLLNIATYYALNSYLLGREFFEMVAIRRMPLAEAKILFRQHRWKIMSCGLIVAFASTLPVVNLFAPIFAIVLMVHLFQRVTHTSEV